MVQALGAVKVVTPGVLVQATFNQSTPGTRMGAQTISFQALPGNAGIVYVGFTGLVRATLAQCLALLPKPASATTGPFTSASFSVPMAPTAFNVADFYIDADNGGDGVLVTFTAQ